MRDRIRNILYEAKSIPLQLDDVIEILDLYHPDREDYDNLYPDYKNEESENSMYDSREDVEEEAKDLIRQFSNLPDPIPIYRVIDAKSPEDIHYDNLGES